MKNAFSAEIWGAAALAAAALCSPAQAANKPANIPVRDWGVTEKGAPVQLYTLKGARGLEAHVSNYGALLTDLIVPAKDGRKVDVLLGFDDFKGYERGGVYGALIGRYVGRISKGGSFSLNGKTWHEYTMPPAYVTFSARQGFSVPVPIADLVAGDNTVEFGTNSNPGPANSMQIANIDLEIEAP